MKKYNWAIRGVILLLGTFSACIYQWVPMITIVLIPMIFPLTMVLSFVANQAIEASENVHKNKIIWCARVSGYSAISAFLIALHFTLKYAELKDIGFSMLFSGLLYWLPLTLETVLSSICASIWQSIKKKRKSKPYKEKHELHSALLFQGIVFVTYSLILFFVNLICFWTNEDDIWLIELLLVSWPTVVLIAYGWHFIKQANGKKTWLWAYIGSFVGLNILSLLLYIAVSTPLQKKILYPDTFLNPVTKGNPVAVVAICVAESVVLAIFVFAGYLVVSKRKAKVVADNNQ